MGGATVKKIYVGEGVDHDSEYSAKKGDDDTALWNYLKQANDSIETWQYSAQSGCQVKVITSTISQFAKEQVVEVKCSKDSEWYRANIKDGPDANGEYKVYFPTDKKTSSKLWKDIRSVDGKVYGFMVSFVSSDDAKEFREELKQKGAKALLPPLPIPSDSSSDSSAKAQKPPGLPQEVNNTSDSSSEHWQTWSDSAGN